MLTLQGIAKNINEPLLGKISFASGEKDNSSTTIIVDPKLPVRKLKRCVASIFSCTDIDDQLKASDLPVVYNVENIHSLSEGDVVEVLPGGIINVLYQINSKHNLLFVTSRCNSNCIMCPQVINSNEANLLDLNLKLISLMDKSTEELALTGGEPTVVGQDLFHLILACKHYLPNTSLLLLTNARRFSDFGYTHRFASLQHPDITIATTLYGDNDIEYDFIAGSTGAFNETVRGIINLATFGSSIEIRIVIHKHTYKRLLRLSEYIYRNMTFVKHIAFMGLETIWRAKANLESLWVEPEEIVNPLEESIRYVVQREMNVSIYNIPLCLLPKPMWKFARQSISEWKNSFDSKCLLCSIKGQCSGMFDSGVGSYKEYLKPVYSPLLPD